MPRAVVWDCDGVLVDSEPHSVASWLTVLRRYGSEARASDVAACTGLGFLPTYAHLTAKRSAQPIPAASELWPQLLEALGDSFGDGLEPFPDAAEAVAALSEMGVPQAVATTSPRSRLEMTLHAARLEARFAATAAGDEVALGKPAPDVYLLAASRLGIEPGLCIAVEDTGHGARAAVAAGMPVIGVVRDPAEAAPLREAGADVVDRITAARVLALFT